MLSYRIDLFGSSLAGALEILLISANYFFLSRSTSLVILFWVRKTAFTFLLFFPRLLASSKTGSWIVFLICSILSRSCLCANSSCVSALTIDVAMTFFALHWIVLHVVGFSDKLACWLQPLVLSVIPILKLFELLLAHVSQKLLFHSKPISLHDHVATLLQYW